MSGLAGILPALVMLCVICGEYGGGAPAALLAGIFALAAVAAFSIGARASRLAFVVIGLALVIWAALTHDDWRAGVTAAIGSGCLIVALFTALSAIRSAAVTSAEIVETGRFLARQPPGRRYLALTIGGHLFGLILLYGSIALLGSLATESSRREPDPEIRRIRTRRMLIAIQRGFAATLCWSPLGFSMVLSTSLVAGARWNDVVLPCLVSAGLLLLGGWALSGVTSPFTASVLLAGALGQVPPRQAGLVWNGAYAAVMGVVLSLWVLVLTHIL